MREILEEELPDVFVSTSSEMLPEIFEHERFSTTVANAVLSPLVAGYVERLEQRLEEGGYGGDLLILHSGGGVMTPKLVRRFAGRLAASGIAAGAIACRHIARLCGFENAIGLDMGGTSTDISLVYEGEMRMTNEWGVEYGYPICFPSIEVLTIGAGGGSLAWIDAAGSLRNGPQSAGADPGPACYRRGGDEPTNTDANVVLGRLGDELVGGAVTLDVDAAADAVSGVAEPLGLDATEAARAILRVANANMADAVRLISIRRGYDPREFALVVFGGAGALHGAALASELAIPTVLVPPNPGITSALGCLLVDIRHDLSEMYLRRVDDASPEEIDAEFRALEAEGRARLPAEGVPEDRMSFQRTIEMRYLGQWRSLRSDPRGAGGHGRARRALPRRARARVHLRARGRRAGRDLPARAARGRRHAEAGADPPRARAGAPLPEPVARRPVHFDEEEDALDTPVYDRDALRAGTRLDGPAIVEQLDSTIVVPPGVTAEVDPHLNIRMTSPRRSSVTAPARRDYTLDPVTFEVLKNAFITTVDQMAEQILRTCHSFVIYARDFSSALCDAEGNTVMQGSQDIAVHVGTLHFTAKAVIEAFGDDIHPGDVFAVNDPYLGGTHFNDVAIIRPIFVDGEIIAFAQSNGHWADVGGTVPGSFDITAKEHFGEGLRIPPVRIWDRGRYLGDVARLILSNTRAPADTEGDLQAQAEATRVCEREILRLVDKYSRDTIVTAFAEVQDYVENLTRPASPSCPTACGRRRTTSTPTRRSRRG